MNGIAVALQSPLFCNPKAPPPTAIGWFERSSNEENDNESVTSSLVRNTPSLCSSSPVLSIKDVIKNAPPTWAPALPGVANGGLPTVARAPPFPFRRRIRQKANDARSVASEPCM